MRISHFLIPVLWWCFCFQYHLGLYTMQEPSYLGKLSQIITRVHKDSHLNLPIKYQYVTGITILIRMGKVLSYLYWCWLLIPCIHLYTRPALVTALQLWQEWVWWWWWILFTPMLLQTKATDWLHLMVPMTVTSIQVKKKVPFSHIHALYVMNITLA